MYRLIASLLKENELIVQILDENSKVIVSLYIDNYSLQNLKNAIKSIQ